MSLRERLSVALREAMKAREASRVSALRLIQAAINDRDIALRGTGDEGGLDEAGLLALLAKMVKQRQDSARMYEEGGRLELAAREMEEISIIEGFLPRQLTADEIAAAIEEAVIATGATSIRDMGKVMGHLKADYTGRVDFAALGPVIRDRLSRG